MYLYFCNESQQRENFNPTQKYQYAVVNSDGFPDVKFDFFFCDTLKLPDKHFIFILRHGSIFNFKRTLKANNPKKTERQHQPRFLTNEVNIVITLNKSIYWLIFITY